MIRYKIRQETQLDINQCVEGETIEQKVDRIVNNSEPITDGAPMIYTERGEGVKPEFDIRTDRFEIAIDAMDKVAKSYTAKREERGLKKESKSPEDSQHKAGEQAPTTEL
ncbi:MAG: hypothetical protein [Microviridae sp.]|nr:MAG: hypothetical protein [Microviridae sp.]